MPSRRWDDPAVLRALAAIFLGAVSLGLLLSPQPPDNDSPEAGFARAMIPHHAQAVQMADTIRQKTQNNEIRALATDIVLSQQGEIGQMRGWLEEWGLSPNGTEPAMSWMGHPTEGLMPGMATPEDLVRLNQASPEEADDLFLELMIPHHQSAVEMADAIQEQSNRPDVVSFAQRTVTNQQGEIDNMQDLRERLGLAPVEAEVSMPASDEEGHHGEEGFFVSIPKVANDTACLAPLPLALFAASWLVIDTVYRRRVWGRGDEPIFSPPQAWQGAGVGGLVASAVLHTGLAPAHFAEAASFGVFFSGASAALAIIAAAILAWPLHPAYLAGAGISIALIVLWALFRIIPPPGAAGVEEVDMVGLFTKATELVAATACGVLWVWDHRTQMRKEGGG